MVNKFLALACKVNIAFAIFIGIDDSLGRNGKTTRHLEAVDYHHSHTESTGKKLAYSKNISKASLADFIHQHRLEYYQKLLCTVSQPFAPAQQIETCLQDVFSASPWAIV